MTADYSQIEMRIMAHLSEDAGLIEAFKSGEDLHTSVAVAGVRASRPSRSTPEMRRRIKAMSYGLAYGLSAFGLSQQLKITADEARGQMDAYFDPVRRRARLPARASSTTPGRPATPRRCWAAGATCPT